MAVSGATVRAALAAVGAVGKQIRSFDELAAGADAALRQAPPGLTAAGAASFLATAAQESAYFRTTVEYGSGQRYAPYIGRGFVQCTWESNYRLFGAWCYRKGLVADPNVFVRDPKALGDFRYAWATAVWYFESTNLWGWANAGDHLRVSQAVNGGRGRAGTSFIPHGWTERRKMFDAFRAAGDSLLPIGGPGPAPVAPAPPPEPPRRRSRRTPDVLYFKSPEPAPGTAKKDWPTILVPFNFDPIGGWGGQCVLKVDHAGRGGWIKAAKWWIRDKNLWSANRPIHFEQLHPVGPNGSERFPGYGWETAPPVGADFIEITTSCPDGLVLRIDYQR